MFTMYGLYEQSGWVLTGILVLSIWMLVWKGLALWHSAKNVQKGWFVALLILNTLGLLPIIYLLWFRPKEKVESEKVKDEKIVEEFIIEEKKPVKKKKKKA